MYRRAGKGDFQRLFRLTHEKLVFCIAEACKHALMLYVLKRSFERKCKAKYHMHENYGLNNDQIYEFNLLLGGGIPSSATAGWPDSPARAYQLFSTHSCSTVLKATPE